MNAPTQLSTIVSGLLLGIVATAHAAPVTYQIDPSHTYPSFEADHMGLSTWRGKFNKSAGQITLDKAAGTGFVNVSIDTDSIDFGHAQMNGVAKGAQLLDVEQFPYAAYSGQLQGFSNGAPTQVVGQLTLHGITKPLTFCRSTASNARRTRCSSARSAAPMRWPASTAPTSASTPARPTASTWP